MKNSTLKLTLLAVCMAMISSFAFSPPRMHPWMLLLAFLKELLPAGVI